MEIAHVEIPISNYLLQLLLRYAWTHLSGVPLISNHILNCILSELEVSERGMMTFGGK